MYKLILTLSLVTIVGIFATGAALSGPAPKLKSDRESKTQAPLLPQDPPGTIDGSATPHLVSDAVAYSMFFNFFSNRSEGDKAKLQAYINQTHLAGFNLRSLLETATYYQKRVTPIDTKAKLLQERTTKLSAEQMHVVNNEISLLQAERDAVTDEIIGLLPRRLGPQAATAIRRHIDEKVKPHIKIVPGPAMTHEMR